MIKALCIDYHWLTVQMAGVRTVFSDPRSPERVLQERLEGIFSDDQLPREVRALCSLYAAEVLDNLTASVESFKGKSIDVAHLREVTDKHTRIAAQAFIDAVNEGYKERFSNV